MDELPPPPLPDETPSFLPPPPIVETPFTQASALLHRIRTAVGSVMLGQAAVVDQVLVAFIAGGHVLLEGKPGLGKTHLVLALAATFGGQFRRIQFTPDLMPGDVTGHSLYDMSRQEFRLKQGPVFCNLLLADEINRAPAKTQAALLEVMQENQVTIDGQSLPLAPPFMTLATQNPIEQEGTYPLPEAQLDRFLMKVQIDYPTAGEEEAIVAGSTSGAGGLDARLIEAFATGQDILQLQALAASIACVPEVIAYAVRLVRATRSSQGMTMGAGTRGAIALVKVGKAFALLSGRQYVTPDDIKSAALPVLRHRVVLSPEMAISGQRTDDFLSGLLRTVEAPR
jgi:MoxR-like ATPase